jgi:hypothetical protein
MARSECEECRAIRQELLKFIESSRQSKPGSNATPQQHADWFDEREVEEDYTLRVRPRLSILRVKLAEHQKLTGHIVSLPAPPGGQTSQN